MTAERDPRDGRPAVVGVGEVVELGGARPQADTLEGAVAQAMPAATSGAAIPPTPLQHIAKAIRKHFDWLRAQNGPQYGYDGRDVPNTNKLPDYMDSYLPVMLSLVSQVSGNNSRVYYQLGNITAGQLAPAIKDAYGDFFFETDMADALGIDMSKPDTRINVANIAKYIPELATLEEFTSGQIGLPMIWDPYLTLLAISPEKRAFLAGALEVSAARGGWKESQPSMTEWAGAINSLRTVLTLQDMLAYGNQVKEKGLKQYMDALQALR